MAKRFGRNQKRKLKDEILFLNSIISNLYDQLELAKLPFKEGDLVTLDYSPRMFALNGTPVRVVRILTKNWITVSNGICSWPEDSKYLKRISN